MTTDEAPPEEDQVPSDLRRAPSLVLVHTGDGKGKSTAAFGVVMRAVARGWPTTVVKFLKYGNWNVGEEKVCTELGVEWRAIGEGFTWESDDLSEDEAVAAEAWRQAAELIAAGDHRLVVLDEVSYPINCGWIPLCEVVDAISQRPAATNVVLTGRDMPRELIEIADTVTEMRQVKHAFEAGIRAMKGIDY